MTWPCFLSVAPAAEIAALGGAATIRQNCVAGAGAGHDRMPAIVPEEKQRRWLAAGEARPEELADCLGPYPAKETEAAPVSRVVNNPRNDTPDCIKSGADP